MRYGVNNYVGQIVPGIISNFATEAKLNEVKELLNATNEDQSNHIMAVNTITNNIKWIQRNSDKLDKWLDANTK